MKLSDHFTLAEFCQSDTAVRLGIDMTPPSIVLVALQALVANVLEPLRGLVGPIHITSGYRPVPLNKAIGGAMTSQHVLGMAADIKVDGMTPKQLCEAIISARLPFDQLIYEFGPSGWCHVSYNPNGIERGEVLTATKTNGHTVYSKGLP